MLQSETDLVRKLYAAINRNDVSAYLACLHPQIKRVEFGGSPSSGTYEGHLELGKNFSSGRETWAEGACEPERFVTVGDKIVVTAHVRVRLKNHYEWIDGRVADAFAFKDGKIIEFHSFFQSQDALEWASKK